MTYSYTQRKTHSQKLPRRGTLVSLVLASTLAAGCANEGSLTRGQTGAAVGAVAGAVLGHQVDGDNCLLYTSPSPRD